MPCPKFPKNFCSFLTGLKLQNIIICWYAISMFKSCPFSWSCNMNKNINLNMKMNLNKNMHAYINRFERQFFCLRYWITPIFFSPISN